MELVVVIGLVLFLKAISGKQRKFLRRGSFPPSTLGRKSRDTSHERHVERKSLMNKSEAKFLKMLIEAFPDHYVFTQVSFNALVTHASYVRSQRWRNAIRSKFN